MQLLDRQPCRRLARFIECYWYVETQPHETSLRPDAILPNGMANLILNLSGYAHHEYSPDTLERSRVLRTRWFSGVRDCPLVVGPTVLTEVIGIRFKPGGLIPFLEVPAFELAGSTFDPDALWGRMSHVLHEQLLEPSTVAHRFRLLERWLLSRFNPSRVDKGVARSIKELERASGDVPITTLARAADLSPRQYRRRFEQAVGLAPKRAARVLRFQRLIGRLSPNHAAPDWAHLALECGYYDQAHLIADFRDFAQVTPGEYLRRSPVVPGFLPVDGPMSLFSNTPQPVRPRIRAG